MGYMSQGSIVHQSHDTPTTRSVKIVQRVVDQTIEAFEDSLKDMLAEGTLKQ